MRQIVLDTETTGLDPKQGHRIIEIGCVEVLDRRLTRQHFQRYLQPDREIDQGAMAVHGIGNEFLRDQPRFAEVAEAFLAFVDGAELVIHNAPFDVSFIDAELARLNKPSITTVCRVLDTLVLAREMYPGQRNSLDALCKRLGIDNSRRTLHGALLDAEILADVYLTMSGGQSSLALAPEIEQPVLVAQDGVGKPNAAVPTPVYYASADELSEHKAWLQKLDEACATGQAVWNR